MSELFGSLSLGMGVFIYCLYFRQVARGMSKPNLFTWTLWLLIGWLNFATYMPLVGNDPFKGSMTVVSAVMLTLLYIYIFRRGTYVSLCRFDAVVFVLALGVLGFWQVTGNGLIANLLLQVCFILSFIPTLRALVRDEAYESPTVWMLAVVTYGFNILAIAFDEVSGLAEFAFPVVNGVLGNGSVLVVTLWFRRYESWF
ncbi:hypothetical protein SCOR_10895 [Sulfidibacter corallicola]|uniref:Uncharacterized protein n=1 Tax=Sulfidibacter corallicola TaxID=2818388 RepID=A0A8A4TF38_SULCO|nr:hypothetical protein [Sulfidibacter corallicola]QTD48157.1 hypothetical protein J3U87_21435 [Sulfidibacter corallicola]